MSGDNCPQCNPPRPVPRADRALRVVNCRRCNTPTGTPGAMFCDVCRPEGNRALWSDADHARERERAQGRA